MSSTTATRSASPLVPSVPGSAPTGKLTRRQLLTILAGLMLGMFLSALDQIIAASAIRTIGNDLPGLSVQTWVTTAYLITSTISTPLYGTLSDLYGRKPCYLLAFSMFIAGSAASSFSTSLYMLAALRALQGLGAGGLFALALAIIGDIVSPREQERYQGYFLAVFGVSIVLGPVIGGFFAGTSSILGTAGWRWVFLVNVPIGLVALVVVWYTLNLPHVRCEARLDWFGAAALIVCLIPLLLVAEKGQTWGWASARAQACYAIGPIGLALFILAEHCMRDEALIPLRFFRNKVFSLGSGVALVIGLGMFGGISVLPLYLQIVKGASPTESGLLLLPLTGGLLVASIVSCQLISRTGQYKNLTMVGTSLMGVALLLMHGIGAGTPLWQTGIYTAVFGIGIGSLLQPITLAVQNALPPRDIGVATSSMTFFRQIGGTLGIAGFLSILFSTVGGNIRNAFSSAARSPSFQAALHDPKVLSNPANAPILGLIHGAGKVSPSTLNDTAFLKHADPRLAEPFFVGFSQSVDLVFNIAAGIVFLGFILVLLMPELPLRTESGLEAQRLAGYVTSSVSPATAAAVERGA